ncbi:MAG: response regulator transcription factor [Aquificae bacterium]|nr:response regulator transcription factor [Aquificota bacterium]
MGKILLIEDDTNLAQSLAKFLEIHGFDVDIAYSYDEGAVKTFDKEYDMYLIDINLGDGNGIELLEALRSTDDKTPVIFITALKDIETIARGFEAGAEDYIKKPFDLEELLIRIKSRIGKKKDSSDIQNQLNYKNLIYKNGRFFKDGKEIELGEVQRKLLLKLLENQGKIVPKESLYRVMINPNPTALRVALTKLKKKTGINIKAVRGLGYTID